MRRDLKTLARECFDLLVIGGGINGVAVARDAALRGLTVALVEKGDFGGATSAASNKIIHGGLRYLQHLDIRRMRESIRERSTLMRIAPHLVFPLPFLIPTFGHGMKGKELLSVALGMNDLISFDRNAGLRDPDKHIPRGQRLSRAACRERVPGLDLPGMTGGVLYHDAQMHSAERLTLAFALSAARQGAVLANYLEVTALLQTGDRVVGARVADRSGSDEFEIRGRVVVNCAGPWSDHVVGLLDRERADKEVVRSKGFQVIVPSLTRGVGLAVASPHEDPDAVVSRGTRHYFITPWRGVSLIGTTDSVHAGDPDDVHITREEVVSFLDELNQAMPFLRLDIGDVRHAFGGLRPITEKNIEKGSAAARKYEIHDHAEDLRVEGLLSVVGVKYTTCRFLAAKAVDRVFKKLGHAAPRGATETHPLAGGEIDAFEAYVGAAVREAPAGIGEAVIRHLVHSYGSTYGSILALIRERAEWAELLPGSNAVIKAEVIHALREEAALHLDDVVMRRTDLGTFGYPGRAALSACADLMGEALGWDAGVRERELARVEALYPFR